MEVKLNEYPYLASIDGEERKIRFSHLQAWDTTIAAVDVSVDDLNYSMNELCGEYGKTEWAPGRIVLNIGLARKHPEDRYCKSTGRDVSLGKIKPEYGWLQRSYIDAKGVLYVVQVKGFQLHYFAKHGDKLAKMTTAIGS